MGFAVALLSRDCFFGGFMTLLAEIYPVAAIGFSLLYLLFGGGLGGAILIFIVAKMLGH